MLSGGVGGLQREMVGAKKFGMSFETQGKPTFFLFGGISRDFAGISRRRPKSLREKKVFFVFNFRSLTLALEVKEMEVLA